MQCETDVYSAASFAAENWKQQAFMGLILRDVAAHSYLILKHPNPLSLLNLSWDIE